MLITKRAASLIACAILATACTKPGADGDKKDAAASDANTPADLQTDAQKFGYAIGFELGHQLSPAKDDLDVKAMEKGFEESYAGQPARLNDKERQEIRMAVGKKIQERRVAEMQALAKKNKDDGDKFLADNGKKPNVKTTASGLEYEVITEGQGDHPGKTDTVTVNYKGTLIDGTEFDSSYDRPDGNGGTKTVPAQLPVDHVIPGWSEGIQLMSPGAKYKFYIPGNLAYGEHSPSPKIPPNATLIFEVELISIAKAPPAPAPAATASPAPAPAKKK